MISASVLVADDCDPLPWVRACPRPTARQAATVRPGKRRVEQADLRAEHVDDLGGGGGPDRPPRLAKKKLSC